MRIAAHLGVLDDRELIEASLEHLARIGVDHVLVCDMGSTDGTWELLKERESPDLQLLQLSNSDSGETYDAANLELVAQAPADWVAFLDVDEFWLPRTGSLRDCRALADHDVVTVRRFNVPLGASGPACPLPPTPDRYSDVLMYVESDGDVRHRIEADPSTPWTSGVPWPKVIARRDCITGFAPAMHDVLTSEPVRRATAEDVVTAHLPFTTYSRFARKVDNIRQVHEHHESYASGALGWHWTHWVRQADAGALQEEFDRQRPSADVLADLRRRGVVRSAADVLGTSAA